MQQRDNLRLRQELGSVSNEMNLLVDAGLTTSADSEKFERLDGQAKELRRRIDQMERADQLYTETRATGRPPMGQPGGHPELGPKEQHDRDYRAAFSRYLRAGRSELSMEDRAILRLDRLDVRDMGTGGQAAYPGATSGFFVPVGFVNNVESAMKYSGPMLSGDGSGKDGLPTMMSTETGNPLPWATDNDTTVAGERIAENQPVNAADVTLGSVIFGAYKYSTKLVKVSIELLQDSAFDLEPYLAEKFGARIGRIVNTETTLGTGAGDSMPEGIVPMAELGATAVGSGTNDGVGGLNTVGSDDLISLEHSVDIVYRRGARYMLHDGTLRFLKTLKDKQGRPLWQPGLAVNAPDTINGYAYAVNNDMDQLQTEANSPVVTRKTVLFGQLSKFTIRRVKELSVLRLSEKYAEYGQVAFLGFARFDSKMLDAGTHPVKYLKNVV
ncbi:MAG: phage major capsid protein [Acidobacteriota bacterium]